MVGTQIKKTLFTAKGEESFLYFFCVYRKRCIINVPLKKQPVLHIPHYRLPDPNRRDRRPGKS